MPPKGKDEGRVETKKEAPAAEAPAESAAAATEPAPQPAAPAPKKADRPAGQPILYVAFASAVTVGKNLAGGKTMSYYAEREHAPKDIRAELVGQVVRIENVVDGEEPGQKLHFTTLVPLTNVKFLRV